MLKTPRISKLKLLFFTTIFVVFFLFYAHILLNGYTTDIPGHIIYSSLYHEGVLDVLPHPVYSLLQNGAFVVVDSMGVDRWLISHMNSTDALIDRLLLSEYLFVQRYPVSKADMTKLNVLTVIVNHHLAASLLMALFVTLNAIIIYFILKYALKEHSLPPGLYLLTTLLLITVIPVYLPFFNKDPYVGQGSPNVWHNPTYLAMKSSAYLIFLLFPMALSGLGHSRAKSAAIALLLVLSAAIKPSFVIVFLPAIFAYAALRHTREPKVYLRLFVTCVPTTVFLLYQYAIRFDDSVTKLVIDPLGVWSLYSPNILVSILLAVAFPLAVLLLRRGKSVLDSPHLMLAWIMYLVSLTQALMLAESGPWYYDANFFWGYDISLDMLFIFSLIEFIRYIIGMSKPGVKRSLLAFVSGIKTTGKKASPSLIFCALLLMLHTGSGLYYLLRIGLGHGFF